MLFSFSHRVWHVREIRLFISLSLSQHLYICRKLLKNNWKKRVKKENNLIIEWVIIQGTLCHINLDFNYEIEPFVFFCCCCCSSFTHTHTRARWEMMLPFLYSQKIIYWKFHIIQNLVLSMCTVSYTYTPLAELLSIISHRIVYPRKHTPVF